MSSVNRGGGGACKHPPPQPLQALLKVFEVTRTRWCRVTILRDHSRRSRSCAAGSTESVQWLRLLDPPVLTPKCARQYLSSLTLSCKRAWTSKSKIRAAARFNYWNCCNEPSDYESIIMRPLDRATLLVDAKPKRFITLTISGSTDAVKKDLS